MDALLQPAGSLDSIFVDCRWTVRNLLKWLVEFCVEAEEPRESLLLGRVT